MKLKIKNLNLLQSKDLQINDVDKDELQANIGWSETHHDVDSSEEAMKSYVSEQIKINKNKLHTLNN
ncbi:hypothetical protein ACVXZY_11055 [Staphylococcus aureus]